VKRGSTPSGAVWLLTLAWASVGFSIYFALGVVADNGLGLTPLLFLVAGLLFVLTMFTYIEGSAMLRERGGSSAFARHAFNELVAFVAGWVILLDFLLVISLAVLSVPHYLEPLVGDVDGTVLGAAIIAAVVLYVTAMNIVDVPARRRPRFLLVLAGADLLVQLLVILVGLAVVFDPGLLTSSIDFGTSPSFEEAVYAAVLAMLAYAGIEAVSNLIPDLDLDPARFGRVVTRSVWLVPVIYSAIAAIALMAVPVVSGPAGPETALGSTYLKAPVLGVVSAYDPAWLADTMKFIVATVAALTLIWAANTAMLGVSRHTFTLAVNRQIPSWLGRLGSRYETPFRAILIFAVPVLGLALFGNVEMLAGLYAFGATLAITIAHVSIIRLRFTQPDAERPFSVPFSAPFRGAEVPVPSVLGAILGALAFVSVLIYHDGARWVGLAWLATGLVGYWVYRRLFENISLTRQVTVDSRHLMRPHLKAGLEDILVPIFGTELDEDIVSTAGLLAIDETGSDGANLVIFYPMEVPLSKGIHDPMPPEIEEKAARATARARDIALEYSGVHVETEVGRVRRAGTGIVHAARDRNSDAIVMGAEPPSRIRGGANLGGVGDARPDEVGPITAYVLKRAPCQVLLTAPPAGEGEAPTGEDELPSAADGVTVGEGGA
jgi:APA family basic amino acid/polyamine antiporter